MRHVVAHGDDVEATTDQKVGRSNRPERAGSLVAQPSGGVFSSRRLDTADPGGGNGGGELCDAIRVDSDDESAS